VDVTCDEASMEGEGDLASDGREDHEVGVEMALLLS
jgi:hypothetical protein